MEKDKQKVVKMVLSHNTTYLRKTYNYLVEKEDENFYHINCNGKLMKYPKFYFIVISE